MGQALYERSSARYAEAERLGEQALRLRERALGADHPDTAATHEVLGYVYDEIGDYARGERHFARALAILEKSLGADDPALQVVVADLGYLRLATGDYASAQSLFERSLARREALYGPASERLISGLAGLAEVLLKQGQPVRAEQVARRVIALREAAKQEAAGSYANLGAILLAQERVADADAACARARTMAEARGPACDARIRETRLGPTHPAAAEARSALAEMQR